MARDYTRERTAPIRSGMYLRHNFRLGLFYVLGTIPEQNLMLLRECEDDGSYPAMEKLLAPIKYVRIDEPGWKVVVA